MREERKKRRKIDKDVEVIISNNTHGIFAASGVDSMIVLEKQGDEESVTFGELRKLRKYLENMDIVIVEVNSDEFSLYDVVSSLRLKVYDEYFKYVLGEQEDLESIEFIDVEVLEDFITDCDEKEFEEVLKTRLRKKVIETTVALYKEHRLSDYAKMTLIKKTRPKKEQSEFWNDVDETMNN